MFKKLPIWLILLIGLGGGYSIVQAETPEARSRMCPTCTAITLDDLGNTIIIYFSEIADELRLITCHDVACNDSTLTRLATSDRSADSLPRTCGGCVAMAFDPAGQLIITFYDSELGDLLLITCNDTVCTNPVVTTVDTAGDVGQGNDVAVFGDGSVHISYADNTLNAVKHALCIEGVCNVRVIDAQGSYPETQPRTCPGCTALALNNEGNAVIQYFNEVTSQPSLAVCNTPACPSPTLVTLPTSRIQTGARDCVGCADLALLDGSRPVISYYDDTNGDLQLVVCDDALCGSFTETTVDSTGDTGQDVSLAVDNNGNFYLAYYDAGRGNLRLSICRDSMCSRATSRTLDGRNGDVGQGSAMVLRPGRVNTTVISYYDFTNDTLHMAICRDRPCTTANTRLLDTP